MPVPSRYADTKIDANGRRVPASEFEEAESAARSTKVAPDTQIAADGVRKPIDEVDEDEVAPTGRTAEAEVREERAAHIAAAEDAPADAPADDDDTPADDDGDDDAPEDDGEKALEDHTVAELKELASDLEIEGRSGMNKDELIAAIESARG